MSFEKDASASRIGFRQHLNPGLQHAHYKGWLIVDFDEFWVANKDLVRELSQG